MLRELKVAPRPHTVEFLRYDMNFNRLTLKWETLEEVRQQGKYVRDAREEVGCVLLELIRSRLIRWHFISWATLDHLCVDCVRTWEGLSAAIKRRWSLKSCCTPYAVLLRPA